jgi:hypothetical protein
VYCDVGERERQVGLQWIVGVQRDCKLQWDSAVCVVCGPGSVTMVYGPGVSKHGLVLGQ